MDSEKVQTAKQQAKTVWVTKIGFLRLRCPLEVTLRYTTWRRRCHCCDAEIEIRTVYLHLDEVPLAVVRRADRGNRGHEDGYQLWGSTWCLNCITIDGE